MTEHLAIVYVDGLEQAIQTVIGDLRVPKNLRTALAVYRDQRAELNSRRITILPLRSAGRSKAVRLGDHCQPDHSILNCVGTMVEGVEIHMWLNDEALDWSVEINGRRHDHVTSEVMEALVECAVIVAETSVMRVSEQRPQ